MVTHGRVTRCRDARSVRPLYQKLRRPFRQVFQRHGFNGNGRTDRASLQPLHIPL